MLKGAGLSSVLAAIVGPVATQYFLFSGSSTATIAGTSASIALTQRPLLFTLTALSGITSAICLIEGATDTALTNWVSLGVITLTAAGSGGFKSELPYQGYRATLIALTGGNAQVFISDANSGAAAGSAVTNPVNTGIPNAAPFLIAQSALPVLNPASATAGASGAFSALGAALPATYANAWIYVPANAYVGLAAGIYFARFSSATAGTIYNILLSPGQIPYIPTNAQIAANPITNAAGTWTAFTASDRPLVSVPIPPGTMGINGVLRVTVLFTANAGGTSAGLCLGALSATTSDHNIAIAGNSGIGYQVNYRNRGVQNSQITTAQSAATETGLLSANLKYLAIDTSQQQYITFYGNAGGVAAGMQLEGFTVEVMPQ